MRSKILSSLALFVSLSIIYVTMSSDKNGNTSSSGTSCGGGCHGNISTATTVSFANLPTIAIAGQTYTAQFIISHATNVKYGLNIYATGGTFATVSSGTKLSGGQLTHSTVLTNGTIDFKWTAPSTPGTYTIKAAGNAVNGNNQKDAGDNWNTTSTTITVGFPTNVNNVEATAIKCYPNPATNQVVVEGLTSQVNHIVLFNLFGQAIKPSYTFDGEKCNINVSALPTGTYFVYAVENGKEMKTMFVKN
jgi:hypothetical protein